MNSVHDEDMFLPSQDDAHTMQHQQVMSTQRLPTVRPTLQELSRFIQSFVPLKDGDVSFLYHNPRHRGFDQAVNTVSKVILSITPTKGVYDALWKKEYDQGQSLCLNVAILHRPFNLDRYRIPRRHGTVLASHKSFDELLTTGWNVQLARQLGIDQSSVSCIQGYKGDPERRIGLVGAVDATERALLSAIWQQFGSWEGVFGFSRDVSLDGVFAMDTDGLNDTVTTIALMNAFHLDEIERVAELALAAGRITDVSDCRSIVYLTGAVRQPGLEAANARNMKVVCVGHKPCEEWGIRFLAAMLRQQYPGLDIIEIDEPEEPRIDRQPAKTGPSKDQVQV